MRPQAGLLSLELRRRRVHNLNLRRSSPFSSLSSEAQTRLPSAEMETSKTNSNSAENIPYSSGATHDSTSTADIRVPLGLSSPRHLMAGLWSKVKTSPPSEQEATRWHPSQPSLAETGKPAKQSSCTPRSPTNLPISSRACRRSLPC